MTLLGLQASSLDCLPIVHVTLTNINGLMAVIVRMLVMWPKVNTSTIDVWSIFYINEWFNSILSLQDEETPTVRSGLFGYCMQI